MNPLQSNFRPGHSKTSALIKITDDICYGMRDGLLTVLSAGVPDSGALSPQLFAISPIFFLRYTTSMLMIYKFILNLT